MDIAILSKNSIKIKGKNASFIVDPTPDMPKTSADAIILLNGNENVDTSRVTDSRIILDGVGGYEVGGVKISGTLTSKGILYKILVDDISIVLGKTAEAKDEVSCQVAVINATDEFNESFVTALEPKIAVIYGSNKEESARKLGAESISSVAKISTSKDKLPEKMEVVALG